MLEIFLAVTISLLAVRTLFWHLQNWQLREYRRDRIQAYFSTAEGKLSIFNLWFFRGILPRPRFSGRILLIIFIILSLVVIDYFVAHYFATNCQSGYWLCDLSQDFVQLELYWKMLIYERFLWLFAWFGVFVSGIPVNFKKKKLYSRAGKIIKERKKNIKVIGITGSYGKSSTREILVHLLMQEFGENSVLTNPENHNTEISIARLIIKSREFFRSPQSKFIVVEVGAYRKGEIKTVCEFLSPQISLLTGIGNQHIELFGSQQNIISGKFEIAEAATEKVLFNADNIFLQQVFADKNIKAVPIGISRNSAQIISSDFQQTVFRSYHKEFTLPWGGEFFVDNAILAIETARELGCKIENLAKNLAKLAPLEKALNIEKGSKGEFILKNLYSQNLDGVLASVRHLAKTKGRKIFVGTPLLELGKDSKKAHREIFTELREIKAETFWVKEEFSDLGKEICGENFHGNDFNRLQKSRDNLEKGDAILFTGRLDKSFLYNS